MSERQRLSTFFFFCYDVYSPINYNVLGLSYSIFQTHVNYERKFTNVILMNIQINNFNSKLDPQKGIF